MTLGFIGTGNMAGAIIGGILESGAVPPAQMGVCNRTRAKAEVFGRRGLRVYDSPQELVQDCKYVLLGVKPQGYQALLEQIGPYLTDESVLISIAAGITAQFIEQATGGAPRKVVLAMPNTPLLVGHGAVALSYAPPTTDKEFTFTEKMFASHGTVEAISPLKLNEIIPVNGSSPAFIYLLTKLFVDEAARAGIDRDTANRLFCHTLIGSARMMLETGKNHQELIDMVTSPGGTTLKGLEAMEQCGVEDMVHRCFEATVKRAYELGK